MKFKKFLWFTPIVGMIYIFILGVKYGFLTKAENINIYEILIGSILHSLPIYYLIMLSM